MFPSIHIVDCKNILNNLIKAGDAYNNATGKTKEKLELLKFLSW